MEISMIDLCCIIKWLELRILFLEKKLKSDELVDCERGIILKEKEELCNELRILNEIKEYMEQYEKLNETIKQQIEDKEKFYKKIMQEFNEQYCKFWEKHRKEILELIIRQKRENSNNNGPVMFWG